MTAKMRWNCDKNGCFNIKMRPKIEEFNDCFPRSIGFGDVDGVVEYDKSFLFLEWKSRESAGLPRGQKRLIENAVKRGDTYIIVVGNGETMEVSSYAIYSANNKGEIKKGSLSDVKHVIRSWVKHVDGINQWKREYSEACAKLYGDEIA